MLSEREQQILCLVAEGLSNRQIAGQLDISENTVKVHVRKIFAKIDVSSRTEASLYAVRAGLIAVPGRTDLTVQPQIPVNIPTPTTASDDIDTAVDVSADAVPAAVLQTPDIRRRRSRRWVLPLAIGVALVAGISYGYAQYQPAPAADIATRIPDTRWQQLPALPQPRPGVLLVVVNGSLYSMGGGDSVATQRLVERYDDTTRTWVAAPALPFALVRGHAWSDGSGVWIVDATPGGVVRHWDGDGWADVATLPASIQPLQIARWQGQTVVLGSDESGNRVWVHDGAWRMLAGFAPGVAQAAVIVNAESLLGVSADGDLYEYRAPRQDWRHDGNIGHPWAQSVATSVLGALLIIPSHTEAVMSAYSQGHGVVGQQIIPAYVKNVVQIVPWQMQLVVADATGSAIGMYQALYQNFAPIAQ